MARERIVSGESQQEDRETRATRPESTPPGENDAAPAVRPRTIAEYVGQAALMERLSIALEAVKVRGDSLEHLLLHVRRYFLGRRDDNLVVLV